MSIDPDDDPRTTGPAGSGISFWAALAVAGIAVAGFGGVVAYGYLAYGDRSESMPAPLVKAEGRPLKVRPDDPGGLNVEHQDKEVFNAGQTTSAAGAVAGRRKEVLLPPPESPLPKPVPAPPMVAVTPAATLAAPPAAAPVPSATVYASAGEASSGVASAVPYPPPLPPPAAPSSRSLQRNLAAAGAADEGAASSGLATQPSAGAGTFRIQIGAMRSEQEARQAWESVKRKHGDVIDGKTMSISRVELPDRGVFFRVHAGPLADRDAARDACAKLVRAGTGCLVVPPS